MKKYVVWMNGKLVGISDTEKEATELYNTAFNDLYEIAGRWNGSVALFENENEGEDGVHTVGYDVNGNEISCGWRMAEVPA